MDWEPLLYSTAELFGGQLPRPDAAETIEAAHQRSPKAVERTISEIANAYSEGTVRSPWGLLLTRVKNIPAASEAATRIVTAEKAIERAEQWIRNAGCHMTWPEAEDELFAQPLQTPPLAYLEKLERDTRDNPGRPIFQGLLQAAIQRTRTEGVQDVPDTAGRLTAHQTPELHARMHALWNEHRPAALHAEVDAIQRGLTHQAQRAKLSNRPPNRDPETITL